MDKNIILQHILVPKHEIMKKEEVDALLVKFGIKLANLPKIREDDPAAKAIDAKKGDVLRIIRSSPTAGEAIYYRAVV